MKKSFQTYIFERFMGPRLEALEEEYNSYRRGTGREKRKVSPLDREIYTDYKSGMLFQYLQDKYGKSYYNIYKSIQLAANESRENYGKTS